MARTHMARRTARAATIVPLAILSAAWTVSLAGVGSPTATSAGSAPGPTAVAEPEDAASSLPQVDVPTRVSAPASATQGSGSRTDAAQVVATSSANGIPSSALAAYQRAETIINAASPGCHLQWQLVAAIGRVESDHGRFRGSALGATGVATPAIYGLVLDGRSGTATIRDTDGGALDGDRHFDRAVGPMQFIPSTWAVVGVDGDQDGVRDPQDVDDAALATAVYLCSGGEDLATTTGRAAAVHRYNHSASYVALVLSVMGRYLAGDFTSVPDSVRAAGYLTPLPITRPDPRSLTAPGEGTAAEAAAPETAEPITLQAPEPEPADEPDDQQPPRPPRHPHVQLPELPEVQLPKPPKTGVKPVDEVLTLADAIVECTLEGLLDNPLARNDAFDRCVDELT